MQVSSSTIFHGVALVASLATIGYVSLNAGSAPSQRYTTGPIGLTIGDARLGKEPTVVGHSTYSLNNGFSPAGSSFATGDIRRNERPASMIRCQALDTNNRCRGGEPISYINR